MRLNLHSGTVGFIIKTRRLGNAPVWRLYHRDVLDEHAVGFVDRQRDRADNSRVGLTRFGGRYRSSGVRSKSETYCASHQAYVQGSGQSCCNCAYGLDTTYLAGPVNHSSSVHDDVLPAEQQECVRCLELCMSGISHLWLLSVLISSDRLTKRKRVLYPIIYIVPILDGTLEPQMYVTQARRVHWASDAQRLRLGNRDPRACA